MYLGELNGAQSSFPNRSMSIKVQTEEHIKIRKKKCALGQRYYTISVFQKKLFSLFLRRSGIQSQE